MKEDGERFAKLIYKKLLESENGELGYDEIINIYDKLDFPLFRKDEKFAWDILDNKVERFKDEKGRNCLRLKS